MIASFVVWRNQVKSRPRRPSKRSTSNPSSTSWPRSGLSPGFPGPTSDRPATSSPRKVTRRGPRSLSAAKLRRLLPGPPPRASQPKRFHKRAGDEVFEPVLVADHVRGHDPRVCLPPAGSRRRRCYRRIARPGVKKRRSRYPNCCCTNTPSVRVSPLDSKPSVSTALETVVDPRGRVRPVAPVDSNFWRKN